MADFGWQSISEQISHHPPISAIHAEGNGWILDKDIDETKSFYYWTMKDIKTFVKDFIIGSITVHNEGNNIIMEHLHRINLRKPCLATLMKKLRKLLTLKIIAIADSTRRHKLHI
ncbi:Oxysterol-binding family protein [Acanthocheilonema viteae]